MALRSAQAKQIQAFTSNHGLAEVFAVLTRLPLRPAIYPSEAWQVVSRNVLPHFVLIDLNTQDYRCALELSAEKGWMGGKIYDALHITAAQKGECDYIYTYNLKHFQDLAGALADRVRMP
jgi:predicted nucleic acid-binding protein